ncbi:unnamed protein product [Leptidea sinapis]|uniref:Uncharacterized protein n=1 Tax=Leptidea sinapis TaxID=189913 RepID=A0A5E4PV18_9NEOP|nr:unnamed protein product [Leptidea sinapis]
MYSHELQTCDWPRNVGCDATGAVVAEDLGRLNERQSAPSRPAPRRNPPPARTQPNPVITSRGQPKYSRQEYEKQQQLYAEVDDLPPVEEIETDRQQRVYRGQPSTIGQVQKDRDGYISQGISSSRTLNANIIPASINQNSKLGSFSFGTQVDERRAATITTAPQTYSDNKYRSLTNTSDRLIDIETNDIETKDESPRSKKTLLRRKRDTTESQFFSAEQTLSDLTKRNDDDEFEYIEDSTEPMTTDYDYDALKDGSERGKRQIRYYLKNGYKPPPKQWQNHKEGSFQQLNPNYNPNIQSPRYNSDYNVNNHNPNGATRHHHPTANPYHTYHFEDFDSQRPFKPSLSDSTKQKHSQININNHIITKSPPISALSNNGNQFLSLNGGSYNKKYITSVQNPNSQYFVQSVTPAQHSNAFAFIDSSQLSSTHVTGKPIKNYSASTIPNKYSSSNTHSSLKPKNQNNNLSVQDEKQNENNPIDIEDEEYDDDESEEDEESEEYEDSSNNNNFKPISVDLPRGYTHPNYKFANIENPFARPDFDFDAFIDKLRGTHYSASGVVPNNQKDLVQSNINNKHLSQFSTSSRPFNTPPRLNNSENVIKLLSSTKQPQSFQKPIEHNVQAYNNYDKFHSSHTEHDETTPKLSALKLKPPNFDDDRQLPLNHNFFGSPKQDNNKQLYEHKGNFQYHQETSSTPSNINLSIKQNYQIPDNILSSIKPSTVTTGNPNNVYLSSFQHSTPKPLTTLANQHLAALQTYWKNPSTDYSNIRSTLRPSISDIPNIESLFAQTLRPSSHAPNKAYDISQNTLATTTTTSTKSPPVRKPIPKPSPEMNDYYYDDEDEQYYYEPVVKPKYMPSSEVKPQRPPMAQNYQEYDDMTNSHLNTSITFKSVTKNHNDVSVATKTPFRLPFKNNNVKLPIPVMVDNKHENNDYFIVNHIPRNRTVHIKIPNYNPNPNTPKPPKYLNQTTLRPYTVRHRLAKPTTPDNIDIIEDTKQLNRGKIRHHNIVAEMKQTTPSDSIRQETRFTKTSHDDKSNSLEPTERVTPTAYSASPRPKMLYNSSQAYNPDQYDPYYAVYDEDGELYKDPDYVQQYNPASLRPAVQQTYRGTPPPTPSRRPVESYTPRPVLEDDYDDALIQGEIPNQNQYQTAIRQQIRPVSTRGRGSSHYSTLGVSESPQPAPNRGTPPTRMRPTLKPSTAIVSKTTEFVDIYANPPRRPGPVYPTPTPDKTAAKCRKDVCLLPDCFCGGKDIPVYHK